VAAGRPVPLAGAVLALLLSAGAAGAQPVDPPPPALLARVDCRALEGPCDYQYAVVNPAGAAARVSAFALLEADESEVRSSAGWSARRDPATGGWRWESDDGAPAGWAVGGFVLSAPGLPRVALAQVEAGPAARAVPTLVPGPAADRLGSARDLLEGLRGQLASLEGVGWLAPGPARRLLDERLGAILAYLERDQRTEALRRIRALADEVRRLAPAAGIGPGKAPGGRRPALGGATPIAPEVRDLYVATLGLATARLGALR
jgi:plasmid stabilization system protein ParE